MNGEHWLPVVGHEKDYWVSSWGAVWSRRKGGLLKPGRSSVGYMTVSIGRRNSRCVQYLVAEAFIGPRPDGLLVLHRDDARAHNVVENLYYGTRTENALDKSRNGGYRFTHAQVRELRAIPKRRGLTTQLAAEYGCSYSNMQKLLTGYLYAQA